MKILAISDIESPYFWDYYERKKLADIDLILSAGDLRAEYLSFLELCPVLRCCTYTAIMTRSTNAGLRKAASVWTTGSMSTRASGSWGLAAP